MEYTEYMETLKEQIQNKRARALVSEEINGHIEEQAQGYEEEGMSREDAKREAVRQMGDPVETGCALNRIHRPAFPWKLFVLAVLLTAASILMSVVISGKTEGGASQAEQLRALLVINGVSFAMIFVIMYFDYTWLCKIDSVIRHTSLWEVVGTDLLRTVSCSDLTLTKLCFRIVGFLLL